VTSRRLSVGGRISASARLAAVAAIGVTVLLLVALALAPPPDRTRGTHHQSRTASGRAWTTRSVQLQAGAVLPPQLARARSAARRFLASYLRFAYGEAPASSVGAVAPALHRRLRDQRALFAPVEQRRHPRVVSLMETGQAHDVVLATALVDDGGIANYAIRIKLRDTRSGWLVSALDGG
jgi:hypothetical protein